MFLKIKRTVFSIWPVSWSTDVSSFYCSNINLCLNDYAWCKLCNISLLLFENNSRSITIQQLDWTKKIVAVITQNKMIDDTLKRQIIYKSACRLLILSWIFQYIEYLAKAFEVLPTPFNTHGVINLEIFLGK